MHCVNRSYEMMVDIENMELGYFGAYYLINLINLNIKSLWENNMYEIASHFLNLSNRYILDYKFEKAIRSLVKYFNQRFENSKDVD